METGMLRFFLSDLKDEIWRNETNFTKEEDKEALEVLKATIEMLHYGRINEIKRIIDKARW